MRIVRKRFLIPACVMTLGAIAFIIHAGASGGINLPCGNSMSGVIYGLYVVITILLAVLAFWNKEEATRLTVLVVVFELGAVFFIIQSMMRMNTEGTSNWYLPLGLGLNVVALVINCVNQRNKERDEQSKGK